MNRLIPLARRKGRPGCVMIPGAGGGLIPYLRLSSFIGARYNVWAVRAAGLVPDEEPERSVPEMADGVLRALEPDGIVPDVVFGWSMGGTVAWEVCATLAEQGHFPDLVLVDCSPFGLKPDPERDATVRDVIVEMLGPRPDAATLQRVTGTFAAHIDALIGFDTLRRYPGRVLLLVCTGESDLSDPEAGIARWRELGADLTTGTVDTDHFRVFDQEYLPALTAQIGPFLDIEPAVTR